jgi:hypothetical protein
MDALCKDTHCFITFGTCPWCGVLVASRERIDLGGCRKSLQRQWDFPALTSALNSSAKDTRILVVTNLMFDGSQDPGVLGVLNAALANDEGDVCSHATLALVTIGQELPVAEAERLENRIALDPTDLSLRIILSTYYFNRLGLSETDKKRREKHILWIIEHAPECPFAGMPYVTFERTAYPESYEKGKCYWMKVIDTNPNNPRILGNSAAFFSYYDKELAKAHIRRAQRLEPQNPQWAQQLAHQYRKEWAGADVETRTNLATQALIQLENAIHLEAARADRFWLLPDLSLAAFEANEWGKARAYASELLQEASDETNPFANDGDAVHIGNAVLGRLALASGNRELTKKHLIESAKCSKTPNLISFGPSMRLARDLLDIGERDVVIDYLKLCSNFWATNNHQPEQWVHTIENGGIPDFGANLEY